VPDLRRFINGGQGELGFLPVLVASILMFVVSPVLADSDAGLVALNLLAFGVLLGALHAAGVRGRPFMLAVGLAAFAWLIVTVQVTTGVAVFLAPRAVIANGFWIVAPIAVLARVLQDRRVTMNTIYGAVTAYFLLALFWGLFLYDTIEDIEAGSFAFSGDPQESHTNDLLYFSLVTQTTLGFGDITPVKSIPRTLAAIQAVMGQVFLVVLVARLVALQVTHSGQADTPGRQDDG
jgi:hypothetical protein